MIKIESIDVNDSELIFDLVEKLLMELREDPDESAGVDRERVLHDWKKNAERFTVFVARTEDGHPVGLITLVECFAIYAAGNFGIINELYVDPDYRCRNVGQKLLDAVRDYGRKKGWKRIDVTAPAGDKWQRTVRFYEREGFVFTGPKLKFRLD